MGEDSRYPSKPVPVPVPAPGEDCNRLNRMKATTSNRRPASTITIGQGPRQKDVVACRPFALLTASAYGRE